MKFRILSAVLVLALGVGALVPAVSAQTARVDVKMEWEIQHEHHLDETGRDIMRATVTVYAGNFSCTNQAGSKANYKIRGDLASFDPPFPKWAGASMRPAKFEVTIPNGEPGLDTLKQYQDPNPTLDIAWDTESRPKKGASFTYRVNIDTRGFNNDYGTPQCVSRAGPQQPQFFSGKSQAMTVFMDDVVENVNGTCDVDTDPDKCLGTGPTVTAQPAEAPLIDTTLLMGGIVALAVVLRRRRSG